MKPQQLINLFEFTSIFLSGDLNLRHQSPDYIMEKYEYVGVVIKVNIEKSELYKEWVKIWGENENINSIFLYFDGIIKFGHNLKYDDNLIFEHWLSYITINDIYKYFDKYIGNINNISDVKCKGTHFMIQKNIVEIFINRNQRYFKLLNILN